MFKKFEILAILCVFAPGLAHAACSRANLTRCLDSVCAINISTNPAARCQYCGTANAGTPASDIRSVSVGTSTKYVISDKELQDAPTDPGQRYVWATSKCIERVADCSPDDVSGAYDKLIEQSCTAAGISAQMASLTSQLTKTKSKTACSGEISACVQSEAKCHSDFSGCSNDTDFANFFSACATESTGCDAYTTEIRNDLLTQRDSINTNSAAVLQTIARSYKNARDQKVSAAQNICTNNAGRESCIKMMCEQRMPNKCAGGDSNEISMAANLCKFYDTACATLK